MPSLLRVFLILLVYKTLIGVDFHDFDVYQEKFTFEEVSEKIQKFLVKGATEDFCHLTPEALYVGDLAHQEIDYVLHLNTQLSLPSHEKLKKQGLKGVKVAIDPGHFGGAFAELEERFIHVPEESIRFCEGDLTYLTALELKRLLEEEGAIVFMTREGFGQGALQVDFFNWLEMRPDLQGTLPLSKVFRSYYNNLDLIERAEKINAFSPDITVIIHYNAHSTALEKLQNSYLTETNFNLAFIPGAFCKGELKSLDARYEFIRLLVTDQIEESLILSEFITAQFVKQLGVPLIAEWEKTSYTDSVCLMQKPGIYCRNLALTRRVHSPLCYGETLIQNNQDEVYRLWEKDAFVLDVPCSQRVKEVACAYFEGIKEYFSHE
jgi:N-acetylmuramoyl-L-alanine amidase